MAFGVGSFIEDTDYSAVYNKIAGVYGRNDTGYGQIMAANPVGNNVTIFAAEWQNLRTYILNSRIHQIGLGPELATIARGQVISFNTLNQLDNMANDCEVNKRLIHSTQYSTENNIFINETTTSWGGNRNNRLNYALRITGSNQHNDGAERGLKYFFNAGGVVKIRFNLAFTVSSPKNIGWQNLFTNIGSIRINYNTTIGASNLFGTTTGFNGISTNNTQVEIYKRFVGSANQYAENFILLKASRDGLGNLFIAVNLVDADIGDPKDDENVTGTTSIGIDQDRPTGAYVSVDTPTYNTLTPWNTSNTPT